MTAQGKSEFILALESIEREKGVRKDDILKMIEGAVTSALRKHMGKNAMIECVIDPDTAGIQAYWVKKAVEKVADPELEIALAEARRAKPDAQAGEDVRLPIVTEDFARIAAQTAKQVLTQKIREAERDSLFDEFKPKEGELANGSVHRFVERSIIVDLGRAEAVLPPREQIRRERYNVGDRVRAVILKVDKALRGPQVLLSRASPLFLRRILEMEVPEVADKTVEVVEIARDPGFRAKVVVRSNNPKVDPIGACVGLRGARIRAIMGEIAGERIDLILHGDDPAAFLGNALAPAKISSVRVLDKEGRRAEIIVPDEQLPLAIGKDGQNVRLACKLTGWDISVKSESQKGEETRSLQQTRAAGLEQLDGIGPKVAEVLVKAGMADIRRLATFRPEDLMTLQGIGEKTAAKIIASAKKHALEHPLEAVAAEPEAAPLPEGAGEELGGADAAQPGEQG